jgi:diacylglycerol kinase
MKKQTILKAFVHALNGMRYFFLHERNGKLQLCAATAVVALGFGLRVSATDWLALLLCIALVLSLEMLNSALEKLCDLVQEEFHPVIKTVKDVAAAAVLFACLIAAIIGCIIFLPKMFHAS